MAWYPTTRIHHSKRLTKTRVAGRISCPRSVGAAVLPFALLVTLWSAAPARGYASDPAAAEAASTTDATLPDAPSASEESQSNSFRKSLGKAVKTIGEDELHIIKSPFSVSALKVGRSRRGLNRNSDCERRERVAPSSR